MGVADISGAHGLFNQLAKSLSESAEGVSYPR